MPTSPVIHWFRRDLRLHDNLALSAAGASGSPILPVFIFDPKIIHSKRLGLPRLALMLQALVALDDDLLKKGSRLWIGYGDPQEVLLKLVKVSEAAAVYYNRDYTPFAYQRDQAVEEALPVPAHSYDDALLLPPGAVLKKSGDPYTVFTPFKRVWLTMPVPESVRIPSKGKFLTASVIASYAVQTQTKSRWSLPLERVPSLTDLGLQATIEVPPASEREASKRLTQFLEKRVHRYADGRNELAALSKDDSDMGSSFLSPYLRLGMLSPRQAYWGMQEAAKEAKKEKHRVSVETWLSELVWREFYMHILHHFPYVAKGSFRPQYDKLEWRYAANDLSAWKEGMTGFPVVDAAMRHLKTRGWMPNRARMIVASFLTKDLLIDWHEGERHFMDWLIDGDPAANNGGWQWSAGTGTDAQPYFRIFNPASQGKRFDPHGAYVKRWLPELQAVPTKYIHEPWRMVSPPKGYPAPIIDRTLARERTLAAFKAVRK